MKEGESVNKQNILVYKTYTWNIIFTKSTRTIRWSPSLYFLFKRKSDEALFIGFGIIFKIFGPRNLTDSVPKLTVFGLGKMKSDCPLILYRISLSVNIYFIISGEKPSLTLT